MTFSKQSPEIYPGEVFADTVEFDSSIRQLMPRYDEMLDTVVRCVPSEVKQILELGCGTGELSLKLLEEFPEAKIIALDYSPRMIQFARSKIEQAGLSDRWRGIEMDFGDWANGTEAVETVDACVSSLAIHHLTDIMKLQLFRRIRQSLNPGGVFWNADPVVQESGLLCEVYKQLREDWASGQGITLEDVRAKIGTSVPFGHSRPDQLATLEAQLDMLKTAGFSQLEVPWKYFGLAIFGGFAETDG